MCHVTEDIVGAVRRAMDAAEWQFHIPVGAPVALKPNLCWDYHLPGAQTSPWVLDAVIEVLKSRTTDILCVEAGQVTVDAQKALRRCGLHSVLARHGVPFVDMSHTSFVEHIVPDAMVLRTIAVPELLKNRILVTLPVMKTHGTTVITGALKNQWGCLPEMRHQYHPVVERAIADVNAMLRPGFAVMDATIAMEGDGPKTGSPRLCDLVLASADLVALDSTAARIMGFDPGTVPHLMFATQRGLGESAESGIELRGDPMPAIPGFTAAKKNLVARAEVWLRHSRARRIVFDTPFLSLFALAARWYNAAWYVVVGRRRRRQALSSMYGEFWHRSQGPGINDQGGSR
ncbi:MAG: DUF362 domain-containing protein [Rhodocyclaceae bacterium]|nr:DUF362 domain-containing protein [Rhodocyclaceae bacterium]